MAWNGSSSAGASVPAPKKPAKKSPGLTHGLIAGAAIVLIGIIALYFISGDNNEPTVEKKGPTKIAEVEPDLATAETEHVDIQEVPVNSNTFVHVDGARKPRSASSGVVLRLMDGTVVTNKPKMCFSRDFERALMVAARPGGMAGPLLNSLRRKYSDNQIMTMLKEMTVPDPTDDSETCSVKRQVQALKEEMLIAIQEGASVSSVLNILSTRGALETKKRVNAYKFRAEAVKMGDPDLVHAAVELKNKELKSAGIPAIMDPTVRIDNNIVGVEENTSSGGENEYE